MPRYRSRSNKKSKRRTTKRRTTKRRTSRKSKNTCPKGKIMRRSYRTSSGKRVKKGCIKDRGRKGKGKKTLPLPSGDISLSSVGYSTKLPMHERRKSLDKASKKYGILPSLRHLNLIRNLQAYDNKSKGIMDHDVKYMKAKYARHK